MPPGSATKRILLLAGCCLLLALAVVAAVALWPRDPLVTRPATAVGTVAITNVRVLDVVEGTLSAPSDVILKDGVIAAISPTGAELPAGAARIDGDGGTLMPGLIDSHCHVGSSSEAPWGFSIGNPALNMERLLYSGVTRVFDPGAVVPDVFELRDRVAAEEELGPTILAAGPVFTALQGHPEPMLRKQMPGFVADLIIPKMTRQISSREDADRDLAEIAAFQPIVIKLAYDDIPTGTAMLTPQLAGDIVEAASAHDLRTVAHIGTTQGAIATGKAGVSAWIHGVYKERIPDEDIATIAGFGIPMVPTMVVFKSYGEVGRGDFKPTELERQTVPEDVLAAYLEVPEDFEPDPEGAQFLELLRAQRDNGLDNVRRLHAAGVTMLAGSDAQPTVVHGPSLHRELGLLRRAGLPAAEVVRSATLYPARFFTQEQDPPYGVAAVGKTADLILVRGNPLDDVGAISNVERVFLHGVPLSRHPLTGPRNLAN